MKKRNSFLAGILLFATFSIQQTLAQNLIPNGDFEIKRGCSGSSSPGFPDIIDSAAAWRMPTLGTSDYLHPCTISSPHSVFGYQHAHSGSAYAGMYIWWGVLIGDTLEATQREYIEAPLDSVLIAGEHYHFEMYVSLAEGHYSYATSSLGAYFSAAPTDTPTYYALSVIPQVNNNTGFITDTTGWVLVSGDFVAAGGESYVTIGNFKGYTASDSLVLNAAAATRVAYVYIDDVSLTRASGAGIQDVDKTLSLKVSPNPVINNVSFETGDLDQCHIVLYDITGQKIMEQDFVHTATISIQQFPPGIYFYELKDIDGRSVKGKFVKQ